MTAIELQKVINDTLFMTGGNSDEQKGFYSLGAKFGYSLASQQCEEKDKEIELWKNNYQSENKRWHELNGKHNDWLERSSNYVEDVNKELEEKDRRIKELEDG